MHPINFGSIETVLVDETVDRIEAEQAYYAVSASTLNSKIEELPASSFVHSPIPTRKNDPGGNHAPGKRILDHA